MASTGRPRRPRFCRVCGVPEATTRLSKRELCADCAEHNLRESARQLQAKSGPFYDRWLEQCQAGAPRAEAQ